MATDRSTLLERVRRLRALAASTHSVHEAATAAAAAERIIAQHQLDELRAPHHDTFVEERILTWLTPSGRRKRQTWKITLAAFLIRQYQCAAYLAEKEACLYVCGAAIPTRPRRSRAAGRRRASTWRGCTPGWP